MPLRHSSVHLDLSSFSFDKDGRKSPSPSTPNGPSTPNEQKSENTQVLMPAPRSPKSSPVPSEMDTINSPATPATQDSSIGNNKTSTNTSTSGNEGKANEGKANSDGDASNGNPNDTHTVTSSPPPATSNFNPTLTAIPQYPPSPKESPKHNREASRSFFSSLKAPKSHSLRNPKSESQGRLAPEKPKSRGSSRDRRNHLPLKPYESSPDLIGSLRAAEQQEQSKCSVFFLSLPLANHNYRFPSFG